MKKFQVALRLVSVAALLCSSAWRANAQNIVQDGSFELSPSPAFSAFWTNVDPSNFSGVGNDPAFARDGNQYAFLGATGVIGSLSQTLNTTAGTTYTLSFSLANDSGVPPNFFQALFNGVAIFTTTNAPAFPYVDIVLGGLVATSSSTMLEFRYRHDDDFFRLDAISVVPEPSTLLLAVPAMAGLGLLRVYRGRTRKGLAG